MAKYKHAPVLTSTDLLLTATSPAAASPDGLIVSFHTRLHNYEDLKDHFRTDSFSVILVLAGQMKARMNFKDYTFTKGHLFLAAPYAVKQLVSVSKGFTFLVITFTTHFLTRAAVPANVPDLFGYFTSRFSPHWLLSAVDIRLIKDYSRQLHRRIQEAPGHPYGKEILHFAFLTFAFEMAALSRKYTRPLTRHLSRKEDLVMRFADLVGHRFRKHRDVQHYAHQLHVTPKYLTETVKEISGKNAGEIIDDFVIIEAKVLLADATLSIAQVTQQLHFSDQSFFGKFFKRHVGVSPKAYRIACTAG